MGRKVKGGQASKKGVDPFRPAVWAGDSVSEAPATTLSYSPPTVGAKSPGLRGLEPKVQGRSDSIIYTYSSLVYSARGDHPFRDDCPRGKAIQYIQVTFKGRGCQGKERECEGWTWRDKPLKSNTPPQPSRSPRRAEETSHSASKGTKGQDCKG